MVLISRDIETLALAFPQVSFTLSAIRRPSEVGSLTDRVLNIPKVFFGNNICMFFYAHNGAVRHRPRFLPFVTSMVEPSPMCVHVPMVQFAVFTLTQEVDEISMSTGTMKLEGFISLRGALTKVKLACVCTPI